MDTKNTLRAVRPVYLLIPRPGQPESADSKLWLMQLEGLHHAHIKDSAKNLRDARKRPDQPVSNDISLKVSGLHHGLAQALGSKSFDVWRNTESELVDFLQSHSMTRPANLIDWPCMFNYRLTARQVSDRLFNSGLPMTKRIFTGVGSRFFAASGRGRIDIDSLSEEHLNDDEERLNWCVAHADQIVLPTAVQHDSATAGPNSLDMTGIDLLLYAFKSDRIANAFNLLGDNLVAPMQRPPEFRLYNASEHELAFHRRVFDIFRKEIEHSESGWVEVIPFPGNDNIVFLKGTNGEFDWVIRDQRDEAFTGNPYFPILNNHELPTAMEESGLRAHLYFKTGEWYERLEHNAETRHYAEGGTAANWPGYHKLLMCELLATRRNYAHPAQPRGRSDLNFVPHRLNKYCLMVSPLVTIQDFWRFLKISDWRRERLIRSVHANIQLEELGAVNLHDDGHLPASVTWFDALAYCRYYEQKSGLPIRLLNVDEWKQISPLPPHDIEKDGWGNLTWAVTGGDVKADGGPLRFGKELSWTQNPQGLPFLSVADFGEWLADFASGYAPVANAATGTGSIDRDRCPAHLTMRYKGMKVGFRLCYLAQLDA